MRVRSLLAVALAMPLAACLSFGPDVPKTLMSLSADAKVAPGTARTTSDARAVGVGVPSVPQTLATLRVPVQSSPTAIAYLKDAQWVEPPNRLFRTLLAETIEARTGRVVPDGRGQALAPATRIEGRLDTFGLDAAGQAAVVVYDATLIRSGQDQVTARRFEARVPIPAITAAAAPQALNAAANQVATQVADWIGG